MNKVLTIALFLVGSLSASAIPILEDNRLVGATNIDVGGVPLRRALRGRPMH
jgi:hypothetical protein